MEREPIPTVTIRPLREEDVVPLRQMHGDVWRVTYPNEAEGVSRQWVMEETARWMKPEALERSRTLVADIITHPDEHFYQVVEVGNQLKGFVHVTHVDGVYHLAGLYLSSELHGSGVADELMARVDKWVGGHDIDLEVVTYNTRAIRFYEKHGFAMMDEDNEPFKGVMPNRTMIRKGEVEEKHEI